MPRNGSGQYNPLTNTWNPPVNGVLATGSDFQAQLNDISAAISQSVSKDGQTPMTASFPMGNNSIVGIASGTAAAPSISPINDTNTGVYFPAADTVAIATGATERARITSGGDLLFATNGAKIGNRTITGGDFKVVSNYDPTSTLSLEGASHIKFSTYDTSWNESARITSGGNMLVGTTVDNGFRLGVLGAGGTEHARFSGNTANIDIREFGNNQVGFTTGADDNLILGAGGTERARITSDGNWLVGTTSGASHRLYKDNAGGISTQISNSSTNTSSSAMELNVAYTGNTTGWFIRGGDSTTYRFYIYSNGNIANTNNSYGAISDAKLKENIVDATPKLNSLMQVRVVNYNLIGEEGKLLGVVAQELEQVFPSMVDQSPDYESVTTTDEDGNEQVERVATGTTTKSVKYSVFVPMLIKAIQEQQTLIESLTARISALEAK